MTERPIVVLDSSVGVKWLKQEVGSEEALALLGDHRDRRVRIVVPSLFLHEVTAVAVRHGGVAMGKSAWAALRSADLTIAGLDDALATAAFEHVALLGCSFYDALAPALADLLGGTLYSADRRAHSCIENAVLLG